MSPAASGVSPYIYAGNSPVDRSTGGTGPRPDDISDSVATYSHYLDPREGWNGDTLLRYSVAFIAMGQTETKASVRGVYLSSLNHL